MAVPNGWDMVADVLHDVLFGESGEPRTRRLAGGASFERAATGPPFFIWMARAARQSALLAFCESGRYLDAVESDRAVRSAVADCVAYLKVA
jgi:hypothetical protein